MQATHDLLYKPWGSVLTFDHIEFPGVVPRTFVGPLILAAIASVPKALFNLSPFATLHIVRVALGALTVTSLFFIRYSVASRFSPKTGMFFTLITATQFHTLFYASRTLPNTFAFVLANLAFADLLRPGSNRRPYRAIMILSTACALFRSELCLYIFTTLVTEVILRNIEVLRTVILGSIAAVATAAASILVDSYFWNRLCYPELEVFYYNVVLNKSSNWGTSSFHWYFSNALPRALGGSYLLAMYATASKVSSLIPVVLPVILFVSMYSVLPHKELRFIFYALPILNAAAAVAMETTYRSLRVHLTDEFDKKHEDSTTKGGEGRKALRTSPNRIWSMLLGLVCLATLGTSSLMTLASTVASHYNYPSGVAMQAMHVAESKVYREEGLCDHESTRRATVHIDVKSAMNGISQFIHQKPGLGSCPQWSYSKREDVENVRWNDFTHLISERETVPGFCLIHAQLAYGGIDIWHWKMQMIPSIYVHRNANVTQENCKVALPAGAS